MKIIDNVFKEYTFGELGQGATFKIGEKYRLKTDKFTSNDDAVNAVDLVSGELVFVMDDEIVHPFQCELIVL